MTIYNSDFDCPACGGVPVVTREENAICSYRCEQCGIEFYVRIHYVEEVPPLETKVFKAIVEVTDPSLILSYASR